MFNLKLDIAGVNNYLAEQSKTLKKKFMQTTEFIEIFSYLPAVDPIKILKDNVYPEKIVARRHSCQLGFTRGFDIEICTPEKISDVENKIVLLFCMNEDDYIDAGKLAQNNTNSDTIYGILDHGYKIANTFRTLQIYHILEYEQKSSELNAILSNEIMMLFADAEWYNAGKELDLDDEKTFNSFLSDIFDKKYKHTPRINSEFLTSQKSTAIGTKTIKAVIKFLLEGNKLKKNAPENFILDEIFKNTDIKIQNIRDEIEKFIHLSAEKTNLTKLYEKLSHAPYGLTKQVTSLFLLGTFLKLNDKVSVFEKGMFQFEITFPIFERLMVNPKNFTVQRTSNNTGMN